MFLALTREISPAITRCELTHRPRVPIDLERARAQHRDYERTLEGAGCAIERLSAGADMPDSVFIEDIVLVLDEVAILTRPGADSRRAETPAVEQAVARMREIRRIEPPGTMDGGDVLVVGRDVYVGWSGRTNRAAISQLGNLVRPFGYSVHPVAVQGCLHLKSAATLVADDKILINPAWVPPEALHRYLLIPVDPGEPYGANALIIGDRVIYPSSFPRTCERLEQHDVAVRTVDVSELAKAEGAVTCCSVIVKA